MKKGRKRILKIHNVLVKWIIILASNLLLWEGYGQVINVSAGEDSSVCPGEVLYMDDLNATITGAVTNGTWHSLGDGYFTPSNTNSEIFSQAITYVPGPADISNGWFTLILASDYYQGNQETDMVNVSFQMAPTLACNAALNVSLSDGCMQEVTPLMMLANPSPPYDRYIINLYDEYNQLIPDAILTKDQIGQNITVEVRHECDPDNSCWSSIRVEDKNPPLLNCERDSIPCTSETHPEVLGFPVLDGVILEKIDDRKWNAFGLDECTDAVLWYTDDIMNLTCNSDFEKIVFRSWHSRDDYGNESNCIQEIYIRKDSIQGVEMPPHFDNIEMSALECGTYYPTLTNGHPHPDTTGYPSVKNCLNLEATFEDVEFEVCGNGIKVLREWWVIDWCTSESINYNQVIKVLDSRPPVFNCPDDLTIHTAPYSCVSQSFLIPENLAIMDCSNTTLSWTLYDSLGQVLQNGSNNYVAELPLGRHTIQYEVTDECGNQSSCTSYITVEDNIAPQAVCDEFTSIAIGIDGTARLFASSLDDGSHDNCEIVKEEVIKMTDGCELELIRGDYVEFCCEEVGQQVMVAYIVTDRAGNENSCMVTVEIEDKLPPVITCPSDLTISCRNTINFDDLNEFGKVVLPGETKENIVIYDGFNSGVAGIDGMANDNCNVTVNHSYTVDLECGQGTITRKFKAVDQEGLMDSCIQVITVKDEDPFSLEDIMWPDTYNEETCVDTAISVDISGEPTYKNISCASVASTFRDKIFPFADGACMKILREWTVIDWCQFDDEKNEGVWYYTQILKFHNTTGPEILSNVQDSLVCLYDEECLLTRYFYDIEVLDDCTSPDEIYYHWSVDQDNDGVVDHDGTSPSIDVEVPIGIHMISLRVEDRCGNIQDASFLIEIKDCKAPTPYCITDLTTVLMHTNSEVEIWAEDFDFNSSDNCTPQDKLVFSFDQDTTIKSRLLTCNDIPNGISGIVDLDMWVTDLAGNQEYCSVKVSVQDNNDNCENSETLVMIGGRTTTVEGYDIDGVEVLVSSGALEFARSDISEEGNYLVDNIPGHLPIDVIPEKLDDVDHGVSTLDIVLIQRHILGFKDLENIQAEIAADVNGSGSISGIDLVHIRKLILGINDVFPNEVPSYKWYDASIPITEENMNDLPEKVSFSSLNDDLLDLDFIGIKIGDVDFSSSNAREESSTSRSVINLIATQLNNEWGEPIVTITSDEEGTMQGFQISIMLPDDSPIRVDSDLPEFSSENYYQKGKILNISWVPSEEVYLDEGSVLVQISGLTAIPFYRPLISLNTSGISSELYRNEHAYSVRIIEKNIEESTTSWSAKLLSNPVLTDATIQLEIPDEETLEIHVFNAGGEMVYHTSQKFRKGKEEFRLSAENFPSGGLYFIHLRSGSWSQNLKVVKVD